MPGLDPGIHRNFNISFLMDCRVKPGNDDYDNTSLWLWVPAQRSLTLAWPGRQETYTPAVVTPPSTTMVCPVMKLDASEPR
jgi:hypothetical protein